MRRRACATRDHVGEGSALRVEVEHEPVGSLQAPDALGPDVKRDGAEIDHVAQGVHVVHDEVRDVPPRVARPDGRGPHPGRGVDRGVLLEEGFALDPVRVAREHHGAVAEIGQEPGRDRLVVRDEVAFRVSFGRPEDLLGLADLDDPLVGRAGRARVPGTRAAGDRAEPGRDSYRRARGPDRRPAARGPRSRRAAAGPGADRGARRRVGAGQRAKRRPHLPRDARRSTARPPRAGIPPVACRRRSRGRSDGGGRRPRSTP